MDKSVFLSPIQGRRSNYYQTKFLHTLITIMSVLIYHGWNCCQFSFPHLPCGIWGIELWEQIQMRLYIFWMSCWCLVMGKSSFFRMLQNCHFIEFWSYYGNLRATNYRIPNLRVSKLTESEKYLVLMTYVHLLNNEEHIQDLYKKVLFLVESLS